MKVTIITVAWNYKDYIAKCIESVLNQTFTDIEYFILDNGSTDGTKEIIEKYAARDSRIRVYRREENILSDSLWIDFPLEQGTGKYFMDLDCDDWIDPDCIERLVRIAEAGDFDITATGHITHYEAASKDVRNEIPQRMCVERKQFAEYYPNYHFFFRTVWAKLVKTDIVRAMTKEERTVDIAYGGDTLYSFIWLRKAKNFCIDNTAMYHYIKHKASGSNMYYSSMVDGNTLLYNDAADFLSEFGEITPENREFMYRVYANGISDVSNPLFKAEMSTEEKLKAYHEILCAPVTKEAFKNSDSDDVTRSRTKLLTETIYFTAQLNAPLKEYEEIFSYYLPVCGRMISYKTAGLLLQEKTLTEAVLKDDSTLAAEILLRLLATGAYAKQYDIIGMLRSLSQNKQLLCGISDSAFLEKYSSVYLTVWNGNYDQALDAMTDILLGGDSANETFMQLYLSIAAVMERIDEFVFGKIKLAALYCSARRYGDCKAVLDDLADMGVEDNEDIAQIKSDPGYAKFTAV